MTVGKVSTFLAQHPVSVYLREVEGRRPHHDPSPFTSLSMRKIETLMNVAISNNNEYWSKANTSVETIDGVSYVRLHGNLIAEVDDNGIKLYDGGWQSNTTKSRLNAILTEHGIAGEGVFQKDFQWFIRLYNGTEFFVTEFRSGMRLGPLANSDLMA